MIIGLGHQSQVGKDTVADFLCQDFGFRRVGLADRLKDVVSVMFGADRKSLDTAEGKNAFPNHWGLSNREILQKVGVGMREAINPDVWVGLALQGVDVNDRIVVPDVRFRNEAYSIKLMYESHLWRITRPGIRTMHHISETEGETIDWDQTISNDDTKADLYRKVCQAMDRIL